MTDDQQQQQPHDQQPPIPLTPAQGRTRRVQRVAAIREGQQAHLLPTNTNAALYALPSPHAPPARARFELEDLRRCTVEIRETARTLIQSSSHQGRLLPQALEEAFGALGNIARVTVDTARKADHFPVHPAEINVITGEEPLLFVIEAHHMRSPDDVPLHHWYINARDLIDLHPITREVLFQAHLLAAELTRLYPHRDVPTHPLGGL